MRIFAIIAAFMFSLSFAASAKASSIIELADHTISYESGFIDPDTLNGEARNVVLRDKSRRDVNIFIDEYAFTSRNDGDLLIIDNLVFNGMTIITSDDVKFTVENFAWTGGQIDGNWLDAIFNGAVGQHSFFNDIGKISVNNLVASGAGSTVFTIDNIYVNSAEMANNPYENLPISDVSFEFRNIYIPLEVAEDEEFVQGMKALGLDGIKFSLALSGKNVFVEDRINTNLALFITAEKMAEMRMTLGLGTSDLILSELNRMVTTEDLEDIGDMYIEMMMVGLFFNNMDIILSDKGILDVMITDFAAQNSINRDQAISLLMDSVASVIGVVAPNTYRQIAPPMRSFLSEGGTLYLGLNPTQPVPAASMFGIIALPDQAKDLLGLSINHTK